MTKRWTYTPSACASSRCVPTSSPTRSAVMLRRFTRRSSRYGARPTMTPAWLGSDALVDVRCCVNMQGQQPACISKIKHPEILELIGMCLGAANTRVSARELLDHPFLQSKHKDADHGSKSSSMSRQASANGPLSNLSKKDPPHATPEPAKPMSKPLSDVAEDKLEGAGAGSATSAVSAPGETDKSKGADKTEGKEGEGSSAKPSVPPAMSDLRSVSMERNSHDEASDDNSRSPDRGAASGHVRQRSTDFRVRVKLNDDKTLRLRFRIEDAKGHSRTIEFPFDVDQDTPMSVASEMVEALSLSHVDGQVIAKEISRQVALTLESLKTQEAQAAANKKSPDELSPPNSLSSEDVAQAKGHGGIKLSRSASESHSRAPMLEHHLQPSLTGPIDDKALTAALEAEQRRQQQQQGRYQRLQMHVHDAEYSTEEEGEDHPQQQLQLHREEEQRQRRELEELRAKDEELRRQKEREQQEASEELAKLEADRQRELEMIAERYDAAMQQLRSKKEKAEKDLDDAKRVAQEHERLQQQLIAAPATSTTRQTTSALQSRDAAALASRMSRSGSSSPASGRRQPQHAHHSSQETSPRNSGVSTSSRAASLNGPRGSGDSYLPPIPGGLDRSAWAVTGAAKGPPTKLATRAVHGNGNHHHGQQGDGQPSPQPQHQSISDQPPHHPGSNGSLAQASPGKAARQKEISAKLDGAIVRSLDNICLDGKPKDRNGPSR
eukprot:scaffold928_cov370-Prasinococcus_capsulatus_cf.AAC.4